MKKNLVSFLGLILLFMAFAACKKNSSKSKTELLTQKAWKVETGGVDANKNGVLEASEQGTVDPCEADDTYEFSTNGSGIYKNNTLKCAPTDQDTLPFTWAFANNETQLTIFTQSATILILDENTLEITSDQDNGSGVIEKYITRFKH